MTAEENKSIISCFLEEVVNKDNRAVADELVATNFVDHNPLSGQPLTGEGSKTHLYFCTIQGCFPRFEVPH
jgi:hypothetical protein